MMLNKLIKHLFILILIIPTFSAFANEEVGISFSKETNHEFVNNYSIADNTTVIVKPKFKKLKAVLLAIFLGHFGVHRIYLGTSPNVPVVYSLTLGGGLGILPLLDIIAILSTKDLEQFSNNDRVFMWNKKKTN